MHKGISIFKITITLESILLISSFYPTLYLSVSAGFAFLYILLFNIVVVVVDVGFIHEKILLWITSRVAVAVHETKDPKEAVKKKKNVG